MNKRRRFKAKRRRRLGGVRVKRVTLKWWQRPWVENWRQDLDDNGFNINGN